MWFEQELWAGNTSMVCYVSSSNGGTTLSRRVVGSKSMLSNTFIHSFVSLCHNSSRFSYLFVYIFQIEHRKRCCFVWSAITRRSDGCRHWCRAVTLGRQWRRVSHILFVANKLVGRSPVHGHMVVVREQLPFRCVARVDVLDLPKERCDLGRRCTWFISARSKFLFFLILYYFNPLIFSQTVLISSTQLCTVPGQGQEWWRDIHNWICGISQRPCAHNLLGEAHMLTLLTFCRDYWMLGQLGRARCSSLT